ncbi:MULTISPECIES: hypothetical protein [Paracoccus]|uniref:Uncharacterized protein n=1 Tax=Paracoccus fontiphilus TaxID=1815556 RepID=A0ABV7IDX4_9RHOB|nr:hypothetical protein [Paracoccus fontiphilus]
MRLLKVLVVLILAAVIGLVGYAYFGDMQPVRSEVRSPIAGAPAAPAAGTETE